MVNKIQKTTHKECICRYNARAYDHGLKRDFERLFYFRAKTVEDTPERIHEIVEDVMGRMSHDTISVISIDYIDEAVMEVEDGFTETGIPYHRVKKDVL